MIWTVTLNVAVDKVYRVDHFARGEVNRVAESVASAGGKGLNVARVLTLLGETPSATGLIGGRTGELIRDLLRSDQIVDHFAEIAGESRTCINIIDDDGISTEFLEPGPTVADDELDRFRKALSDQLQAGDVVVFSGSLPRGCQPDFYAELIADCKCLGARVILDSSGEPLRLALPNGPDVVKPNREELEALTSMAVSDEAQLISAARAVQAMGAGVVVVSLGKDGILALDREQRVYRGTPPRIEAVNAVGCGDSMVAALALTLSRQTPLPDALQFAMAVSAANAMNARTGYFDAADLDALRTQGSVTTVDLR